MRTPADRRVVGAARVRISHPTHHERVARLPSGARDDIGKLRRNRSRRRCGPGSVSLARAARVLTFPGPPRSACLQWHTFALLTSQPCVGPVASAHAETPNATESTSTATSKIGRAHV